MSALSAMVYVVDDDAGVRKGMARLMASAGYRVETFETGRAYLQRAAVDEPWPACMLLDVNMPDLNGLDLQRELNNADSVLPIVFLSGQADVPMSVRAMKQGAADFITKPPEEKVLLEVIARAMDRAVRNAAFKAEIDSIKRRIATLTPREHEVMQHVVAGRLNKQIAGDLGTVLKTAKVHRGRVMKKMGVRTLADLVRCIAKVSSTVPRNG